MSGGGKRTLGVRSSTFAPALMRSSTIFTEPVRVAKKSTDSDLCGAGNGRRIRAERLKKSWQEPSRSA